MVEVPTSKLRLADSSCCSIDVLLARTAFRFSMAVQHVEIGLGDAQDEILPGLDEIGFGLGNLKFRLIVGDPVLPAEQRLGQA